MGSFPLGMKQLGGALKYLRLRLPHCSVFLSATFYSPTSGVLRTVGWRLAVGGWRLHFYLYCISL